MNVVKKVSVWLAATTLAIAATAILFPKQAAAVLVAQVQIMNKTVPVSNLPNTPIYIRDINAPGNTPFQTTLCSDSVGGNLCRTVPSTFTTAVNQRLVIEYTSISCSALSGTVTGSRLDTTAGGSTDSYTFPLGQTDSNGQSVEVQQTRIYADPGTAVNFFVLGSTTFSPALVCRATLSGFIETP